VDVAIPVITLALIVAIVVTRPLLSQDDPEAEEDALVADLEAAKEAKYREIRDAELDLRMGKLSEDDHRTVDRELRAEAIDILQRLDKAKGESPAPR
jgi:hypothetical protein